MTATTETPTREAIGLFAGRDSLEAAVKALMAAGFERSDLSLLSSHESIDAAGKPGEPWKEVLSALVGELKYEGPLVASGAIFLAGGAVAATIAGLVAAATAGIAAKELIGEITSTPHTEDFARSLEAGSVILWVRAEDETRELAAQSILEESGGTNVHIHEIKPRN